MNARVRKAMNEKEKGFTLIELLVVIIIIGILSAIAIPVFLNQRKKAVDSSIKSDLRTVATAMETAYTDNQVYPDPVTITTGGAAVVLATTGGVVASTSVKVSPGNQFTVASGTTTADTYCIWGFNARGTSSTLGYNYSSNGGLISTKVAQGTACP